MLNSILIMKMNDVVKPPYEIFCPAHSYLPVCFSVPFVQFLLITALIMISKKINRKNQNLHLLSIFMIVVWKWVFQPTGCRVPVHKNIKSIKNVFLLKHLCALPGSPIFSISKQSLDLTINSLINSLIEFN